MPEKSTVEYLRERVDALTRAELLPFANPSLGKTYAQCFIAWMKEVFLLTCPTNNSEILRWPKNDAEKNQLLFDALAALLSVNAIKTYKDRTLVLERKDLDLLTNTTNTERNITGREEHVQKIQEFLKSYSFETLKWFYENTVFNKSELEGALAKIRQEYIPKDFIPLLLKLVIQRTLETLHQATSFKGKTDFQNECVAICHNFFTE